MEKYSDPRIVFAERLDNGVIVTFADGKCAFYSAALLYDQMAQAEDVTDLPNSDEK